MPKQPKPKKMYTTINPTIEQKELIDSIQRNCAAKFNKDFSKTEIIMIAVKRLVKEPISEDEFDGKQ
ncbi:hypothetical protein EELLY_v1c03670 [Entomoplasma ellychniae]|uniref:Uncharacterized protein n=1 Tax=Entomoplasma ellychniae TaxID=2114 RepID=A0A8E2QVY7_9MOLU|nr:hypothetical protein [Entomoplasma ellychniae]PPE04352.1 hypothetical protein EELLY_v1c00260 [Entomoplasma ellychniae]PPE04616.1 hypothetical protein EELLY_v1c02960 [Entomoplasma ellychniae]PPE04687.1 hypothetical protein EELLY_v1c03670 [Entomoplasma ellychniae]